MTLVLLVWPNQNGIPGGSNHVSSVIFLSSVYLVRQFAPFREPGTRSCPIFSPLPVFWDTLCDTFVKETLIL